MCKTHAIQDRHRENAICIRSCRCCWTSETIPVLKNQYHGKIKPWKYPDKSCMCSERSRSWYCSCICSEISRSWYICPEISRSWHLYRERSRSRYTPVLKYLDHHEMGSCYYSSRDLIYPTCGRVGLLFRLPLSRAHNRSALLFSCLLEPLLLEKPSCDDVDPLPLRFDAVVSFLFWFSGRRCFVI